VLEWAARESLILLTFDKDFGELARTATLPSSCGVILFRMPTPPPGESGARIAAMVAARQDWAGHFSVSRVECGCARWRPYDRAPQDAISEVAWLDFFTRPNTQSCRNRWLDLFRPSTFLRP
jgi:Domain of unknown function (DUF5615)